MERSGSAEIISINTGRPKSVRVNNKEVRTGIFKTPVHGAVYLSRTNFEGDEQADLVHHGGREKAVCVYPYEHYPYWEEQLRTALPCGAFGENLTTRGLLETDVCVGDIFQLGEAVVQVSQPRQPCFKLSVRYGVPDMPLRVQHSGYTGFYFRVLQEGIVSGTDGLTLNFRHPKAITVAYANEVMHGGKDGAAGLSAVLAVEELSVSWRATLQQRLDGIATDTRERLNGE